MAALILDACSPRVRPPDPPGVCWQMTSMTPPRFVALANSDDNMETCAAHLEQRFLVDRRDVTGAYSGFFIFVTASDVMAGERLDGPRFRVLSPGSRRKIDDALATLAAQRPPAP
jgi:hypothetical protein